MARSVKPPDDFDDAQAFLAHIRKQVQYDIDADRLNREAALEDSQFFIGKQWLDWAKAKREAALKPCLTYNRLQAFVAQVVGNRRLNETTIKVLPDNGGTKAVATVREDLIRNIQKVSRADVAYDKAFENQLICGIGNFRVELGWSDDNPNGGADVFEQDIRIMAIPNAMAVVWDRASVDPTGADAGHVTVLDNISNDSFKERWPDATPADLTPDSNVLGELRTQGWVRQDDVRAAAFWRIRSRKRTLAMFNDGSVRDITNTPNVEQGVGQNADGSPITIIMRADGSPVMREVQSRYAEMYLVSGTDLLEGPYELPISRVPVFRVPGWEVNVGEERHRWGLVRFLKDPQRLHNYWRSVIAEKLLQTPQAPWIAPAAAVAGREKEWRNAHLSDDKLLIYNDETAAPPTRTPPAQLEQALIQEAEMSAQDMRDISNIHEASLGVQSNEVSGKAILARQRVGELGTVMYQDNLNAAIEQCGGVVNQLITAVYEGPRVIKTLGGDDKQALQVINDANNPQSVDITLGRYSVTITTGPSYTTKRVEAAESMLNMVNAMPQTMAAAAPDIIENQDWPGADKIARTLRRAQPPGLVDPEDMTPEMQQQQAAQAQAQEKQAALSEAMAQTTLAKAQAEVAEVQARTQKEQAEAAGIVAKSHIDAAAQQAKARSMQLADHLAAIEVATGNSKEQTNVSG